jgi:hypothetical protein
MVINGLVWMGEEQFMKSNRRKAADGFKCIKPK